MGQGFSLIYWLRQIKNKDGDYRKVDKPSREVAAYIAGLILVDLFIPADVFQENFANRPGSHRLEIQMVDGNGNVTNDLA